MEWGKSNSNFTSLSRADSERDKAEESGATTCARDDDIAVAIEHNEHFSAQPSRESVRTGFAIWRILSQAGRAWPWWMPVVAATTTNTGLEWRRSR